MGIFTLGSNAGISTYSGLFQNMVLHVGIWVGKVVWLHLGPWSAPTKLHSCPTSSLPFTVHSSEKEGLGYPPFQWNQPLAPQFLSPCFALQSSRKGCLSFIHSLIHSTYFVCKHLSGSLPPWEALKEMNKLLVSFLTLLKPAPRSAFLMSWSWQLMAHKVTPLMTNRFDWKWLLTLELQKKDTKWKEA